MLEAWDWWIVYLLDWRCCQQVLFWGCNKTHCCTSFSKWGKTSLHTTAVSTSTAVFLGREQLPMERWGAWDCWLWPDWVGGAGKSCDLLLLCTCSYSQPSNPVCVKRLGVRVHHVWTCTTHLIVLTMYSVSGYIEIIFIFVCKVVQRRITSLLVINCTVVFTPQKVVLYCGLSVWRFFF